MRKFFLFALLCAATAMMAETKVETFTPKSQSGTSGYYMAEPTTVECAQASWTVLGGGVKTNVGNMGSDNFASLVRAKRTDDTFEGLPYIMSDSIEGGIDSLWFTWNSNGKETGKTWNVHVYVNDQEVGAITEAGAVQIAAGEQMNVFKNSVPFRVEGKFVIKIVNEFDPAVAKTSNVMRLVLDDLSWNSVPVAGEKTKPEFSFSESSFIKKINEESFSNPLFNGSDDDTPVYESSNPEVVTVNSDGEVTIKGVGEATITASINETETYKAASASYTVRIVPENWNMETFTGAHNVTLGGQGTYSTTVVTSTEPSESTGLKWTSWLGSVRDNLGGMGVTNIAAAIRARKPAEVTDNKEFGYLLSSTITGGIDSLAFDWSCNGTEEARENPWNIVIYINDVEVGSITDKCTAIPAKPYRFSVGNLKIDGDFTIKIVNKNDADANSNHYRFVVDNIEWYSYEAPCEPSYGILVDGETYIAGTLNTEQTGWTEYKIVADLEKDQTIQLYDNCAKAAFLPNGQDEGGYWFTVTEGVWSAPAKGEYTIYLKMYGYDNNWIWTSYKDTATGIDNGEWRVANGRKVLEGGHLYIIRAGVKYDATGQMVK